MRKKTECQRNEIIFSKSVTHEKGQDRNSGLHWSKTFFKKLVYLCLAALGLPGYQGFLLVAASRGYSSLQCSDFSLQQLLLLWSKGSGAHGLRVAASGLSSVAPGLQSTASIVAVHGLSCSEACGIFPGQESNLCLLHWQADSLPLSHQGSLRRNLEFSVVSLGLRYLIPHPDDCFLTGPQINVWGSLSRCCRLQFWKQMQFPKKSVHDDERVTGRKVRGLQTEGIGCKCQTFVVYLSIEWQEETNYKCQIFFLLYTKLKGGFS